MRTVITAVLIFWLVSCGSDSKNAPVSSNGVPPSPHWIQSKPLETLMQRIASQQQGMQNQAPDDVESANTGNNSAARMASLALELSQAARTIPETVNLRHLSDADERAFVGEANNLAEQAVSLHNAALESRVEPMQRSMLAIHSTCLSCHSRFKELAGDLERHPGASGG